MAFSIIDVDFISCCAVDKKNFVLEVTIRIK